MPVDNKLDEIITVFLVIGVLIVFGVSLYIDSKKDSRWEYYGEVISCEERFSHSKIYKYVEVINSDKEIVTIGPYHISFYLLESNGKPYVEYNKLSREYRCYLGVDYVR